MTKQSRHKQARAFRLKVLSVVNMKTNVFRDVTQRDLADKHQRSGQIVYLNTLPKDGEAAITFISCAPAHQMTLHQTCNSFGTL